jgi:hypothetical protein
VAGEPGAFGAHPFFKRGHYRHAPFFPHRQSLLAGQPIDLTLDVK